MKIHLEKVTIGLGIWLFILPFTGFPISWKTFLTVATSLVFIYIGALLLKASRERERAQKTETKTATFTETIDHPLSN